MIAAIIGYIGGWIYARVIWCLWYMGWDGAEAILYDKPHELYWRYML